MQTSSVFFAAKPAFLATPIRVKSQYKQNTLSDTKIMATPKWAQKTVVLPAQKRGCHLVTPKGPSAPWKHTMEGPDDMPAHIKSSMFGCTLTVPITDRRLNMGTWQGIWLCEHRDYATPRKVVVTLNGI
ncbi:hypothetical protein C5167_024612 [Papaver somniferum]|uniref:Secondary thiamine-phosphate synthase enzyme n=1 Tax=Papaver somniferum TaxID=3469 RepID=A0A4Y7JP31_PAPSO|nr:hypothetical protein C5167_024612 [Papaver somniferum]